MNQGDRAAREMLDRRRRYEIARDVLAAMVSATPAELDYPEPIRAAQTAVNFADALIARLRRGDEA